MNGLRRRLEKLSRKLAPSLNPPSSPILLVEFQTREQVEWFRRLPEDAECVPPAEEAGTSCISFTMFAFRLEGDLPAPPGVSPTAWRRRVTPKGTRVAVGGLGLR